MKFFLTPATLFLLFVSTLNAQNKTVDSLLTLLNAAKEDTGKVKLLWNIGAAVVYQNPSEAIPFFKRSFELANVLHYAAGQMKGYSGTSTAFAFNAQYDSALTYIDTAIFYARKINDPDRLALVYSNRADAHVNLHDYNSGLKDCDTAMSFANQSKNKDRVGRIYSIVSDIYTRQDAYKEAMTYTEKAIAIFTELGNPQMMGLCYSDKGDLHLKLEEHQQAKEAFSKAIRYAEESEDIQNLSAYYGSLSMLLLNEKKYEEAEMNANKAKAFARQEGNTMQEAVIMINLAEIKLAQNHFDEAIKYGLASYKVLKGNDLLAEHQAAVFLAKAYHKEGDWKLAYDYLQISSLLNDSLKKQQFGEQTAKLQTQFRVKEKDNEIQLLAQEKEIHKQQSLKQRIIAFSASVFALLLLVSLALLVNRSRLKQRIKEMRLRNNIAADLHDEVGSSLSSIYMLSQVGKKKQSITEQTEILKKVEVNARETMDRMSDIVWMIKPGESDAMSLKTRIEEYAYSVCEAKDIKLDLQVELQESKLLVAAHRKNIYLICKEAINNAAKYSGTLVLHVLAKLEDRVITIIIEDEGCGFIVANNRNGNGLGNMSKRAGEMAGILEIDTAQGKGTKVKLIVPLL